MGMLIDNDDHVTYAPMIIITYYMCLDWCTFFGDRVGPIGTVFFTYVFILISISIPTFEKNRAKSALVSDLPKTSNNNIKTFLQTITSSKNRILFFPKK